MSPLLILLAAAAAASAPLPAPQLPPQSATRAEVKAQRVAVEQRFAREQAECEQRFAVSPCLEALRLRRQDALAPLIRHEHQLATDERRARAAAQTQRVKERVLAAAQDEGQRRDRLQQLEAAPAPQPPAMPASHPVKARSPEAAESARQPAVSKAETDAAERRARAQDRDRRMRQRIADNEAKQKSRGQPAAPLPLPSPPPPAAASAPN